VLVLAGTMWGQRLEFKAPPGQSAGARQPDKVGGPAA